MSSIARPPDPCLVAIILIVRSRAGPRFVFHYPPNPLSENGFRPAPKGRRPSRAKSAKSNESSSSEESGSTSDEDEEESHAQSQNPSSTLLAGSALSAGRRWSNFGLDEHGSVAASPGGDSQRPGSIGSGRAVRKRGGNSDVEDDPAAGSDRQEDGAGVSGGGLRPPWESLLGLPADVWEKLLSPSRSWHKRRFEVGINDLAFVGWPVFVREDGTWRKQRRKKTKKTRAEWEGGELGHNENPEDVRDDGDEAIAASTETLSPHTMTASESQRASMGSVKSSRTLSELLDGDDKDSMTMFNVVFVLDPPLLEYSMRIREIYDNITKKFAKALKWEQARTDYVWREAQHISHIKEKAKETRTSVNTLYTELINQSSLARAIYTIYSSISASKIASVPLSPDVSISLQIPPLTSTPYLPGPSDKAYPGLWLTTADSVTPVDDPTADENTAPHHVLAKHFALLLLSDEATILKDVEASGGALAPALAHYIRCSKPTKSFAQISASSGIPLSTIQMLASHLVYWRRARAIPPLHQRDTYIVSPNCDLSKLEIATTAYQLAFPTLPSLPKMLSALSGTPRPYGSFIPSKDHKEAYFAILAWLLRGGWVTQLRTFARVKVSPEIKMAVEMALRREEVDKYLKKQGSSFRSDTSKHSDETSKDEDNDDDASSSSSSSLASQGSGEETPMPGRYKPDGKLHLSHSLLDRNTSLKTASLILFPHRASPLETRWLDEIVSRFPEQPRFSVRGRANIDENDPEYAGLRISMKKLWPAYIKYFNGMDALEKVPVRENLKRKLVWQVLTRLGLVTSSQSSIELNPSEQVLIGVRHW
ncbi:nitrogen permease regulator 3 family protein [Aspergillus alliaceus]|uniref:nitrogen permease regulator 3 family protein n=1 Tax=Petromyces alliaceus TaxID=209559 RepID=UPI0012A54DCE|nr:nitrogen permease regulator of amino acid transport activity 3-domain-containing protein [Aspergillus alliaceus]KAB8230533.1 nitrogen permease regulator of amino acid transport activity 3-domain-containing protein [Aspergillus alliaceus]